MQIVIDLPNDFYERVNNDGCMSYTDAEVVVNAVYCGKVLPKGHGRLIDGDALRASFRESIEECRKWANEVDSDTMMYARISQSVGTFVEASLRTQAQTTLVDADKEVNE